MLGRRRKRVAVIGAGIAGLAAAHRLVGSSDVEVVVFEGSQAAGGKLRLGQVGGVAVDLGAESMLNRRPEGVDLAGAVGLGDAVVHPAVHGASVWTRGAIRPLPPSLMGVPASPHAAAKNGILSRRSALRASFEPRLGDLEVVDDVAVGKLVARRLGHEVRDRLVDPLLGGVYAGHADDLSLLAAVPQLAAALQGSPGLLAAAQSALEARAEADAVVGDPGGAVATPIFAGVAGGVGRLAREVARDIQERGASVRFGAMVRHVAWAQNGWRVVSGPTARARLDNFDGVVVAAPARAAGRMLRDSVPDASRELDGIDYASVAIVTVAFDAAALNADLVGSGFLVPHVDRRTIKAATYSSRKWSWQSGEVVVMRCSVGRHREEADLQRDDKDLVEAAVGDLRRATGLRASVIDSAVTRWGGGLPQYAVGHLDRVRRIRDAVAATTALEVCGAYLDGVGIPAVIAGAQAAATQVIADLAAPETMDA